jgi:predicted aldo/keto reductase-like oxidoreductase
MRRFDFDTVLVALNAADVHRLSFIRTILPEAERRGLGVIGMKVYGAGTLIGPGGLAPDQAMRYVLSLPGVSTVVIGCGTPGEVEQNARIAREFEPMSSAGMRELETSTRKSAGRFTSYKVR